jgi:uncharacterized protein YigE (DUF2233 family)
MRKMFKLALLVLGFFPAHAKDEEKFEFEGVSYRLFRTTHDKLQLHWKDESGTPYGQFSKLQSAMKAKGKNIQFMMNAGIFDPGGIPSGLHVENGMELRPINLRDDRGNFYLKPNGVFAITADKALILESNAYVKAGLKPRLALQSGPLLLQAGIIHPSFQAASPNKKHRNGVGVTEKGDLVFAITEFHPVTNRVNLHGFARLFLHLGCKSALFLDGDLSEMFVRPTEAIVPGNRLGAFLSVSE